MLLVEQLVDQRFSLPDPFVLGDDSLKYTTPIPDRDRPGLRRSEPSSRAALMDEQSNPWDLVQPQDVLSRHRGGDQGRRCELLGPTTLLSPG